MKKTPIAVALIIMGGLLVMTPALAEYLHRQSFLALISRPGLDLPSLYRDFTAQMDYRYQFGCWLTGSLMVVAAFLVRRRDVA
jgi:hypothetical protein